MDRQFEEAALEAGFTKDQIEFMDEWLAKYPHTHSMDEVDGLETALEEIGEGEDVEDEEE